MWNTLSSDGSYTGQEMFGEVPRVGQRHVEALFQRLKMWNVCFRWGGGGTTQSYQLEGLF